VNVERLHAIAKALQMEILWRQVVEELGVEDLLGSKLL